MESVSEVEKPCPLSAIAVGLFPGKFALIVADVVLTTRNQLTNCPGLAVNAVHIDHWVVGQCEAPC
jgi:hypothetical protein